MDRGGHEGVKHEDMKHEDGASSCFMFSCFSFSCCPLCICGPAGGGPFWLRRGPRVPEGGPIPGNTLIKRNRARRGAVPGGYLLSESQLLDDRGVTGSVLL